jgi:hypothetical protein
MYNVPPPLGTEDKLKLSIDIDLRKIVEINEKQGTFTVKLKFVRIWTDRKLKYHNLKKNVDNKINLEDMKKIWKPWSIFANIKSTDSYTTGDTRDKMIVKTYGNNFNCHDLNGIDDIDNTYIFDGSKNALNYERDLTVEWMCDFDMKWYPFDTQSCNMQMYPEEYLDFVPKNFTYNGPVNLAEHYVKDFKICLATVDGRKGIVSEVVFGRPLFSNLLTTTLPTVILIMICLMTTIFDTEYFDMVVMVNLTALLVLATL